MRRVHEGHGFHTITEQDLAAEKALSILNSQVEVPTSTEPEQALFKGLVLQQHLDAAEDALSKGKLDVFKAHVHGVHANRK